MLKKSTLYSNFFRIFTYGLVKRLKVLKQKAHLDKKHIYVDIYSCIGIKDESDNEV